MDENIEKKKRHHYELIQCFNVINSCLQCYYDGKSFMHRPIAAQLRILYCDIQRKKDNSLFNRAFTKFDLSAIKPVKWLSPDELKKQSGLLRSLRIAYPNDQEFKIAQMPIQIIEFDNGLEIADIEYSDPQIFQNLSEWTNQELFVNSKYISIKDIIRTIADKGGGAHVDSVESDDQIILKKLGPNKVDYGSLLMIALARSTMDLGIDYIKDRKARSEVVHGDGDLLPIDRDLDFTKNLAQISPQIREKAVAKYNVIVLHRIK